MSSDGMMEPTVVFKDKDFLVVFKPAGLLMHPFRVGTDSGKKVVTEPTLTDWLKIHYPEVKKVGDNPEMRPGLVHRLDRETSGILLVARNQEAFLYFKSLFQKGEITKRYMAVVHGRVKKDEGVIDRPISLKPGTTKRTVHAGKMTKTAVTEYQKLEDLQGNYTLLEVRPQTGRTHQIRVHLASLGHPIIGDSMYGPKKDKTISPRLMLQAFGLEFTAQDGRKISIEERNLGDFEPVLRDLRKLAAQSP